MATREGNEGVGETTGLLSSKTKMETSELNSEHVEMHSLSKEAQGTTDSGVENDTSHAAPSAVPANAFENHVNKDQLLGVLPLSIIMFYAVSGGPFGLEEMVQASGPFYTLLGLVVTPFVWSLQEAAMTAELSTTFPHASGGVIWAEEAFGPAVGWMQGWLSWVSGATDNAIYPVLFLDYVYQMLDVEETFMLRFAMMTSVSLVMAYLTWRGLQLVGNVALVICLLAMSPFFIFVLVGIWKVDPSRWFTMPVLDPEAFEGEYDLGGGFFPYASIGGVLLRPYLNNLFWNFNSFDSAANFSEDVKDPGKVIPISLFYVWIMVFLGYFLPLLVALGATDAPQSDWVDGYMANIGGEIFGKWMEGWIIFAAGVSNLGLFQAEFCSDSLLLMGMAERGMLPAFVGRRSVHGTPTFAILIGLCVVIVLATANVEDLIEMLNFNYSLSLLLEYAAFIKLRMSMPDITRPYKVPLSTTMCMVMLTPTVISIVAIMLLASYNTFLTGLVSVLFGLVVYWLRKDSIVEIAPRVVVPESEVL